MKDQGIGGLVSATWVSGDYQGELLVGAYGVAEHMVDEETAWHLANDSAVAEIAAEILDVDESELRSFLDV